MPPKKEQNKPNILVIFGDDIGITNLSVYSALHELKEEKVLAAAAGSGAGVPKK